MVLRPVGREPAVVYWLRRGIVLSAVLVLLAAGYYGYRHLHHHKRVVALPTPSASPTPRPSGRAATPPCPDSAMTIAAGTDASSYPPGANPVLTLTITNVGRVTCVRDVGPDVNAFTVTSGGYPTFSSADCNRLTTKLLRTFRPRATYTTSMTWALQRSLHGCPTLTSKAKAGYYDLVVSNGGLLSNKVTFALN